MSGMNGILRNSQEDSHITNACNSMEREPSHGLNKQSTVRYKLYWMPEVGLRGCNNRKLKGDRLAGIIVGSGTVLIFLTSSIQVISGKKDSAIGIMRAGFILLIAVDIIFVIFTLILTTHLSKLISDISHPAGSNKVASSHEQE